MFYNFLNHSTTLMTLTEGEVGVLCEGKSSVLSSEILVYLIFHSRQWL